MLQIKERFLVKSGGPPDYYLGNDYRYEGNEGIWTVGSKTYAAEAVRKVKEKRGTLHKCNTPLPVENCHPEIDDSSLLSENDHKFFRCSLEWVCG
jgi:hypothetical protein